MINVDVATTLTPLEVRTKGAAVTAGELLLTGLRYYVDVFPEDLEEAAEMLAGK